MSNPLTPPREDPTPEFDFPSQLNGVSFITEGDHASFNLQSSLPTPVSHMSMELDDSADLKAGMEERSESHDMSYDEDQEMSGTDEGGVPLTTTSSHDEYLNAELDAIDSEIMGSENLEQLFLNSNLQANVNPHDTPFHNPPHNAPYFPDEYADYPEPADEEILNSSVPAASDLSNLPEAMSQVSEQLQYIQDGQTHGEFTNGLEEQQAHFHHENIDEQFNLSLPDFLNRWAMSATTNGKKLPRGPNLASVRQQYMKKPQIIHMSDLNGEKCDIQGINWDELGVSRLAARQMRRQTYKNYTNLRITVQRHPRLHGAQLSDHESYFRFRRMEFEHDVHLSHFQLRNLMASPSRGNIFYAGRSRVLRVNPAGDDLVIMDLTDPTVQPLYAFSNGIQISTLTAAHDILVAGGFCGEYGLTNLRAGEFTKHAEGLITDHHNSITNHIQVHLSRGSSLPLAAFASNDNGLRILDISTNKFIKEQKFECAINCSSISPDQRLRVLVGDTRRAMICNAETGEILQELDGHRDFGFACDWADDGWTVATGNQDMQIKIWDARKWTNSWGESKPVSTIAAEMAGVRKLKFSPLGSGKRVLVAAEPADFISVIDAETFTSKQTLSFFGEIGGIDFSNNGQDLIIANCDAMRGGIMEFERCNLASEALYGLEDGDYAQKPIRRKQRSDDDFGLDWRPTEKEILWHPQTQRTATHRKRKAVNLASMGAF